MIEKIWLTKEYKDYISSIEWIRKRDEKLESVGYKCFHQDNRRYKINEDGSAIEVPECHGALQVHHLSYDNLGRESLEELRVLCKFHHDMAHELISSNKRLDTAINTFAEKKYGEDWGDRVDYDCVSDEFYEWIDRK